MNYRNHITGRFSKMPLHRKVTGSTAVLCLLIIITHASFQAVKPTELFYKASGHAEAAVIFTEDSPATIDEMKADVLDRLTKCENPNQKPIVFDTNGVASVGNYQWQPHSFQHYWKKMTGEELTEKEAVVNALDDEKARRLASYVIFETDNGVGKDWFNCNKWHDLDTLVSFIKSHE